MAFADLVAVADRVALQHLGETVRYAPRVGEPADVRGVFSNAHVRAEAEGQAVTSSGPAVFVRLEDLPADPGQDDPVITRSGVAYRVREAQKDGEGGVLLLLVEV